MKSALHDYLPHVVAPTPESIRSYREGLGISQATFARILGVCRVTIGRYETGEVTAPTLLSLALPEATRRLRHAEVQRRARVRQRLESSARYQRLRAQAKELAERGVTDPDAFW